MHSWTAHSGVVGWTIRTFNNLKLINDVLGLVFEEAIIFEITSIIFYNFKQIFHSNIENSTIVN